jgi:lipopolysaccharide/colanic/teichoic acid biosynthesis glycosyltransferase
MSRIFDVVVALVALVLLSPLLLLIALAVRLTSRGPVIYRARRTGRFGKPFDAFKVRSMSVNEPGPPITRAGDPRVTPLGRILRDSKADELPQLVNVLRGEMSLVGPRPEDPKYTALYDAAQRKVLDVRPGMIGAASLAYRDEETLLTGADWEEHYIRRIMPDKLRMDLEDLARRTFLSDVRFLVRAVVALLIRRR